MTFLVLTIALWCLVAFGLGWLLCAMIRRMPLRATRMCQCDICTGKGKWQALDDLRLSAAQVYDVQTGVFAVGLGTSRLATLGFDYYTRRGVGQLVIAAIDGPLWARVVAPAIEAHMQATRSSI